MFSQFLDKAKQILEIKKFQVAMPVARKAGTITPLVVGDDLGLRTSLVNPQAYDREMIKLLHKHVIFNNEDKDEKPKYDDFVKKISNYDKMCLIWGLYKTTYETLGKRLIKCENEMCKNEFEREIEVKELLHDDTMTVWEETDSSGELVPFHDYTYQIVVPFDIGDPNGKVEYVFDTKIPTIDENNKVLGLLTTDDIQRNLQGSGTLFSLPEQMTLLTKSITIRPSYDHTQSVSTSSLQEITIAFNTSIPRVISDEFVKKYNEKFEKYQPNFYISGECPVCKTKFKKTINIEIEFFRRCLFDTGEGVEVI
jgi:hypothetical protein